MKRGLYFAIMALGAMLTVNGAMFGDPILSFVGAAHVAWAFYKLTKDDAPKDAEP